LPLPPLAFVPPALSFPPLPGLDVVPPRADAFPPVDGGSPGFEVPAQALASASCAVRTNARNPTEQHRPSVKAIGRLMRNPPRSIPESAKAADCEAAIAVKS
jgi:hypothetical protein